MPEYISISIIRAFILRIFRCRQFVEIHQCTMVSVCLTACIYHITMSASEFLLSLEDDAPMACVHPFYPFFISFRCQEGRDLAMQVRKEILLHMSGVWRVMEEVFVDDIALREGELLESELAEASEHAGVFIVLASEDYLAGPWSVKEVNWRSQRADPTRGTVKKLNTIVCTVKGSNPAYDEEVALNHECMTSITLFEGGKRAWQADVVAMSLDAAKIDDLRAIAKAAWEMYLHGFDTTIPTVPTLRAMFIPRPLNICVYVPDGASADYVAWANACVHMLTELLAGIPKQLRPACEIGHQLLSANTVLLLCHGCVTGDHLTEIEAAAVAHDEELNELATANMVANTTRDEGLDWASHNMENPRARMFFMMEYNKSDAPTRFRRFRVIPFFPGEPCKEANVASAQYDTSPHKTRGLAHVFQRPPSAPIHGVDSIGM
jgi:hypothetical protein